MNWGWVGRRFGKAVPLSRVRIDFTVSMDDVAAILADWVVSESDVWTALVEAETPVWPDLTRAKVSRIVRHALSESGSGIFESYWGDDFNARQIEAVRAWSRAQCRAVWPRQSIESWGI